MATPIPSDNNAYRFPVSVKGVIVSDGHAILLKNERDEWELPGGKLEPTESPRDCVVREIREELGVAVSAGPLLDSWVYHIHPGVDVLIVTYGCIVAPCPRFVRSSEHKALGQFREQEIDALNMPGNYKQSVVTWFGHPARTAHERV